MSDDEVEKLYDAAPEREWERLESRKIEFGVTCRVLTDHLDPTGAKIIDIGGGPGRYSLFLAELGHEVSLVDVAANCIAYAKERSVETGVPLHAAIHADARDLSSFSDEQFDAALLLGPLYHLKGEQDRRGAVKEALRVLRPGGMVFAAFLNRYSVVRYAAKTRPWQLWEDDGLFESILTTGVGESVHNGANFLRTCYFSHPAEIEPFMEELGLTTLDLVGCEGVVAEVEDALNALPNEHLVRWVELNLELGRRRELHAAAAHLLYVGRKSTAA